MEDVKLINAYFSGELSEDEEQAVYDRINKDADFREHFELVEVLLHLRAKKRIKDCGVKLIKKEYSFETIIESTIRPIPEKLISTALKLERFLVEELNQIQQIIIPNPAFGLKSGNDEVPKLKFMPTTEVEFEGSEDDIKNIIAKIFEFDTSIEKVTVHFEDGTTINILRETVEQFNTSEKSITKMTIATKK